MIYKYGVKPNNSRFRLIPTVLFMAKDKTDKYKSIAYYDRKLTDQELDKFEMDYLGVGE